MIPVIHTVCGKQVAWHDDDAPIGQSIKYVRMDGSRPGPGTRVREICPHCNALIENPMTTLKLDFSKPKLSLV